MIFDSIHPMAQTQVLLKQFDYGARVFYPVSTSESGHSFVLVPHVLFDSPLQPSYGLQ